MSYERNNQKGGSLVELAIGLLILSIAIIPIVIMTGNTSGKSSQGAKEVSNEKIVANTLMEQAISNDAAFITLITKHNVLKQKKATNKIQTETIKFPKSNISYRWTFKNLSYSMKNNKQVLPDGNYLIDTTLELFPGDSKTAKLILGTKVLVQEPKESFKEPLIGIMLLVDMTPSMSMSKYGWGHNPLSVIDPLIAIAENKKFESKDIPAFTPKTPPEEVLNFIYKYCDLGVKQDSCIGTPQQNYKKADDFVFGLTNDNPKTDFDERYIPSILEDLPVNVLYDYKEGQLKATEQVKSTYASVDSAVKNGDSFLVNSGISRIEMVRSSLYSFINLLEKEEAGPTKNFKIGFLPFSNSVNLDYLLKPETADTKKGYSKLKEYIKSINRKNAPKDYVFDLIGNNNFSTDLETALKTAHKSLLEDTSLTHRIIVLITDWNHCVEIPKNLDIMSYRICIKKIIKAIQSEETILLGIIEKRTKKNPSYKIDPNDPVQIKLVELEQTKEWFLKFVEEEDKKTSEMLYQPYHSFCSTDCQTQTESPALNQLIKEIYNGTIDGEDGQKTDIYVFGIIDSARPPAASILANMTAQSDKGEFLTAKDIKEIPNMFYYLVLELNKLTKVEQAKRYLWNKK